MKNYTQAELLRTCINKPQLFYDLPTEAFDGPTNYLIDRFKQQAKLIDKPTLHSIVREIIKTEENVKTREDIINLTKQIQEAEVLDSAQLDLAIHEVLIDAKHTIFKRIAILIEAGADDQSLQQLQRRLTKLQDTNKKERYLRPIGVTDYDKLQEYEVEELVSTIKWLNDNNVKFRKKDLYALIAHTNGGKTIVSTWMALQLSKAGHSVLYLAQEESRTETLRRVYQACLGLTKHQYENMSKERLEYLFNQYIEIEGFGRFDVVEWPGISVSRLIQEVDEIEEEMNFKYDTVFIDYSRHISTTQKSNANWEAIGKVFEELKTWAMLTNKLVFTAVQLNRESSAKFINRPAGQPAPLMDVTDVSGAFESTHWCQYIWGISFDEGVSRTAAEARPTDSKGTFRFQVVKQKHGDLGFGDIQSYRFLETMDLEPINLDINNIADLLPEGPSLEEL